MQIYTLSVSRRILHAPSFSNFYPLKSNFVLLVRKPLSDGEGSARTLEINEWNLGQCMTQRKQELRMKQEQTKRIMERLNGNVQYIKILHSCIMGSVVPTSCILNK